MLRCKAARAVPLLITEHQDVSRHAGSYHRGATPVRRIAADETFLMMRTTCLRVTLLGVRIKTRTREGVTDTAATVQPDRALAERIARSQNRAVAGIFNNSRRLYMVHTT